MALRGYLDRFPRVDGSAFIDESAQVIGDVTVGGRSSVWFNAVIRGDVHFIRIGEETNVQDLACLHVTRDTWPVQLGDRVTIGHGAKLHGCTVEDEVLIGIGAIVLDAAVIGAGSIVGAGALVTPRTAIPPGSLVLGAPARVVRPITEAERAGIRAYAANYVRYRLGYLAPREGPSGT